MEDEGKEMRERKEEEKKQLVYKRKWKEQRKVKRVEEREEERLSGCWGFSKEKEDKGQVGEDRREEYHERK